MAGQGTEKDEFENEARRPSLSTTTWMSTMAGTLMAGLVALVALPLVWDAEARYLEARRDQLHTLASLLAVQVDGDALARAGPGSVQRNRLVRELAQVAARYQLVTEVEGIVVLDAEGRAMDLSGSDEEESRAREVRVRTACPVEDMLRSPSMTAAGSRISLPAGTEGLVFCLPVPSPRQPDRSAALVALEAEYVPPFRLRVMKTRAWITVLGGGTFAVLAVILGLRFLLRPIRRLSDAASRMAAGERGVRVRSEGPAELRALGRDLNALAQAVEDRESEVLHRLEAVSRFARYVAHEVRNPLQTLTLRVNLAAGEPDGKARQRHLDYVQQEIRGLERLVKRFLQRPGPLEIHPAPHDLDREVRQAVAGLVPRAKELGVTLALVGMDEASVVVDGALFRQALVNLVQNALQEVGDDPAGRESGEEAGRVEVSLVRGDHAVRLFVDDNGGGVPPSRRERVFEPYVTHREEGSGLGLALVRQFAEAHRGSVRCTDSPLGGARFELRLPRPPKAAEPPRSSGEGGRDQGSSGEG